MTALAAATPRSTAADDAIAAERDPLSLRALRLLCIVAVAGIPLAMSWTGYESFRIPKELLFRAIGLLALALFTIVAVAPRVRAAVARLGREAWLGAALVGWTIVSLLASTHRTNGLEALGTLLLGMAIFVAFLVIAERSGLSIVYWTYLPAAANITLFLLQRLAKWSPWGVPTDVPLLASTSFLGNANDLGMTLLLPVLSAYALLRTERNRRRRMYAIAFAVYGTIGLVFSESVASIGGFAVGLWILLFLEARSWKKALRYSGLFVVAAIVAIAVVPRFRERIRFGMNYVHQGRYNEIVSGRLVPSLVAIEMLRERPLTGYGPGSFRAEYFDHKLLVDQKYRSLLPEKMSEWSETRMLSFGETHDEHLQVASELGLPGYVLFAAILVVIARRTRRRRAQTRPRGEFGALLALPAVVAFAVSVLAQFPLRLAAPLTTTLFVAAMIVAWTGNAEPENGEPEASA